VTKVLSGRPTAVAAIALGVTVAAAAAIGLKFADSHPGTDSHVAEAAGAASATPLGGPAGSKQQGAAVAIPVPTIFRLADPSTAHRTPRPVSLLIPSIGVRTPLIELGITADGSIEVPSDPAAAGWYTRSPRPGAIGSSIILGHVDSLAGPAVFFRLAHLRPGARVLVRRTNGTLAVFGVYAVRSYDKSHFPTAAVYGPAPDPELRLVTCGGVFDQRLKSYLSNVVVYARAVH
jgi:sortase (surface protein transpeptidase)